MTQVQQLPESIVNLQTSIATLREAQSTQANPALSLPLPATQELLQTKEAELEHLNRQIASLQSTTSRKTRELDKLEAELKPLEVHRLGSSSSAREAQRRKDEGLGGVGDELEARGRWWRAVEGGLKGMLEV
jgi:chromosome segregation ATPase